MICYKDKLKMVLLNSKKPLITISYNNNFFIAPIIPVENFDEKLKHLTDLIDNQLKIGNILIQKYESAPCLFIIPEIEASRAQKHYQNQFRLVYNTIWEPLINKKDSLKKELITKMRSAEDVLLVAVALKYLNYVYATNSNKIKDSIEPYKNLLNKTQKRILKKS